MKVVINKCWGGFGVSIEAMKRMFGKCEHVIANDPQKYYGSDWKKRWAEDQEDKFHRDWRYFDERGWPVTDKHGADSNRSCPVLVETVEKLGEKASGSLSKLRIVDVPDHVSWEINEYDGMERVAETHDTWG